MRRLVRADHPVAPIVVGAEVYFGERLTGRIRRITPDGRVSPGAVATVPVVGARSDQRGLLGLARGRSGRIYASGVRPSDRRLVIVEVSATSAPRLVWVGPVSADRANGGGLAITADGLLLVGVGDLLADRSLESDPSVPNRKIVALDVDGPADQTPLVRSSGWNNPYAITVAPDGVPWVADNAGGSARERVGRANRPARDAPPLGRAGEVRAPAALVALGGNRFGVCGYVSHRVDEARVVNGAMRLTGRVIARPCAEGMTLLPDRRLMTATEDAIWVSRGPVR